MSATVSRGGADLHLHSRHSDGTDSPAGLVEAALRQGLEAIALTDHDTVEGVAEAMAAGRRRGLRVIAGVELTSEYRGHDIHLLGYCFDPANGPLLSELATCRREREERGRRIVERLNALGIHLTFPEVRERAGGAALGRPHVADALLRSGAVASLSEAFRRYLAPGAPAFVPRRRLTLAEARRLVGGAGGVVILAHPHLNLSSGNIQALAAEGIDGLETTHPRLAPDQCRALDEWARERGLLATGGSDCHGADRPPVRLGTIRIPLAAVERLESRRGEGSVSVHRDTPTEESR